MKRPSTSPMPLPADTLAVARIAAILIHGMGVNSFNFSQVDVNHACSAALAILRTAESIVKNGPTQ